MDHIGQIVKQWSDVEKAAALAELLKKFPLPLPVFFEFAASTITTPMEYCILDKSMRNILLFERAADDPFFAGKMHVTGSIQLPGECRADVWRRMRTGAKYGLGGADFSEPIEIGTQDTMKGTGYGECPRGQECSNVHVVEYLGGPVGQGEWYPLAKLPRTGRRRLLSHQQRFLAEILVPWLKDR